MQLTEERKDELIELVNIGYARAAGALSELTGQRITLRVPDVTIHNMDRITPALEEVLDGEVTVFIKYSAGRSAATPFTLRSRRFPCAVRIANGGSAARYP